MKYSLITLFYLCWPFSLKILGDRGDCIPEQSPCKDATANCCDGDLWACRWTEEEGYRCYERYPLFDQTNAFIACIPLKDKCSKERNSKCCDDGRCKLLNHGWFCTARGGYPGPSSRTGGRNCTKKRTHK